MKCENCGNNCCGVSFKELLKKPDYMNDKLLRILISQEETDKILNAGFKRFLTYVDNKAYVKMNSDKSCVAFKDGKCEMYEVRPLACQLYPYYFDASCGILKDNNCPGSGFQLNDYNKYKVLKLIKEMLGNLEDTD